MSNELRSKITTDPRRTLPSQTLQGVARKKEELGRGEGHVSEGSSKKADPEEDQQEDQPLPDSLPLCPVGLSTGGEIMRKLLL